MLTGKNTCAQKVSLYCRFHLRGTDEKRPHVLTEKMYMSIVQNSKVNLAVQDFIAQSGRFAME